MNYAYPSSVARNAAAILAQLAGQLVAIYLGTLTSRILALCYPSPEAARATGENLLLIWDAGAGAPFPLPLDEVTHIGAGGKTYHVQLKPLAEIRPAPRRRYRLRRVVS